MVLPRRPLASWASVLRQRSAVAGQRTTARQTWNKVRARGYATGGDHGHAKPSSDVPWLIGSVAFTVPACWYIGLYTPDPNAHHDEHGEHGDHEEHEEEADHDESEKAESKEAVESDDEKSEGGEKSDSEDEKQDTPDTSDDDEPNEKSGEPEDPGSAVKAPGDQSTQSGKQEGVHNTDTIHPSDPDTNPDMPKKPEGPDTSKAKGTVNVDRPQA